MIYSLIHMTDDPFCFSSSVDPFQFITKNKTRIERYGDKNGSDYEQDS